MLDAVIFRCRLITLNRAHVYSCDAVALSLKSHVCRETLRYYALRHALDVAYFRYITLRCRMPTMMLPPRRHIRYTLPSLRRS